VHNLQGQYIAALVAATPGLNALVQNMLQNADTAAAAATAAGATVLPPEYYYGAMEQTLASQLGIVPFFYYPVFYTITAFVKGVDREQAVQRAKDTFIPLMKRNLLFWIPVQFIQFGYIDENLQIPFLSVAGLAWTFIISLFAGNAKAAASSSASSTSNAVVTATATEGENLSFVVQMDQDSDGVISSNSSNKKLAPSDLKKMERTIVGAVEKEEKQKATVLR
jgi:hypothetical protein